MLVIAPCVHVFDDSWRLYIPFLARVALKCALIGVTKHCCEETRASFTVSHDITVALTTESP